MNCRYCADEATAARIDHDGSRIDVCAKHNFCCGACLCYSPPGEDRHDGMGECRRLPPLVIVGDGEVRSAYPDVDPREGWCVEGFKPR